MMRHAVRQYPDLRPALICSNSPKTLACCIVSATPPPHQFISYCRVCSSPVCPISTPSAPRPNACPKQLLARSNALGWTSDHHLLITPSTST